MNITPKIILLNGPPGSGKDTAGEHLEIVYPHSCIMKLADPLKRAATAIYHDGDRHAFNKLDTLENKGKPQDCYFGKTCREIQIGISEAFMKPFHDDKRVFGKILKRRIKDAVKSEGLKLFFITDSGFRPEAEELIEEFGAENVFLVRLYREGHTYNTDSRGYIELEDLGVQEFNVKNHEGDKKGYFFELEKIVNKILNEGK